MFLKQSAAVTVPVGKSTDATGLGVVTTATTNPPVAATSGGSTGCSLIKAGTFSGFAPATFTHLGLGDWSVPLTTAAVNTLGPLKVSVVDTALGVLEGNFVVLPAAIYDWLFGSTADTPGTTTLLDRLSSDRALLLDNMDTPISEVAIDAAYARTAIEQGQNLTTVVSATSATVFVVSGLTQGRDYEGMYAEFTSGANAKTRKQILSQANVSTNIQLTMADAFGVAPSASDTLTVA